MEIWLSDVHINALVYNQPSHIALHKYLSLQSLANSNFLMSHADTLSHHPFDDFSSTQFRLEPRTPSLAM
jgi:hypothetical protein